MIFIMLLGLFHMAQLVTGRGDESGSGTKWGRARGLQKARSTTLVIDVYIVQAK